MSVEFGMITKQSELFLGKWSCPNRGIVPAFSWTARGKVTNSPLEWALTRRALKPVMSRAQFLRVNGTQASSVTFPSEIRRYIVYVPQKSVKIFGSGTEKVTRGQKKCVGLIRNFVICTDRPTHFDPFFF